MLSRLSYAFSRVVLVCEGSSGFQAQVRRGQQAASFPSKCPACTGKVVVVLYQCRDLRAINLEQVLCGTDRLLALGRCSGLHLQAHATTSTAATAQVRRAVWNSPQAAGHVAKATA